MSSYDDLSLAFVIAIVLMVVILLGLGLYFGTLALLDWRDAQRRKRFPQPSSISTPP